MPDPPSGDAPHPSFVPDAVVRTLLVGGPAIVLDALCTALRTFGLDATAVATTDALRTRHAVRVHAVDVVVLILPDGAPEVVASLEQAVAVPLLVVVPARRPETAARALGSDAAGVLLDDETPELLADAVERAAAGRPGIASARTEQLHGWAAKAARARRRELGPILDLSPRQQDVLAHLVAGRSPQEMAPLLGISLHTVRTHVKAVLRTMGASTQLEAAAMANAAGWEPDDEVEIERG